MTFVMTHKKLFYLFAITGSLAFLIAWVADQRWAVILDATTAGACFAGAREVRRFIQFKNELDRIATGVFVGLQTDIAKLEARLKSLRRDTDDETENIQKRIDYVKHSEMGPNVPVSRETADD